MLKKTEGRKALLISLMNEDNAKSQDQISESKSSSSDEWEKVQKEDSGKTSPLNDKQKDWDGIIGFFHPFWYASFRVSHANGTAANLRTQQRRWWW